MQNVLILGSKGTLGTQLVKLFPQAIGWDREDVEVTDFPALRAKVGTLNLVPDAIINCVSFNDVDGAEDRPALAHAGSTPGGNSLRSQCASRPKITA
jgi:dTDP-4-dehydrorhamnose reductase